MDTANESLVVYRELAEHYDRLGQVSMRDRFLMLAADAALESGQPAEAERLRQRLLATSRHHMLRPYASFAEAARSPDVETYLRDLKSNYPLADARDLLNTLRSSEPARPIPPTAPLLDMDRPGPSGLAGPAPIPFRPDDPPGPAVPMRPRAQPVPARRAAAPPAPRPAAPLPLAPVAEPIRPTAAVPAARPRKKPAGGSWLSAALFVLAAATGLVLAAYTLARPFLPSGWLP